MRAALWNGEHMAAKRVMADLPNPGATAVPAGAGPLQITHRLCGDPACSPWRGRLNPRLKQAVLFGRRPDEAGNLRTICKAMMDRPGAAVDRNLARRRIFPAGAPCAIDAVALARGPARGYAVRAQRRGRRLRRGAAHPRKERRS